MSTSAIYSPHPTPTSLPATTSTDSATLSKTRYPRARSARQTSSNGSVSPTRPAGTLSTRSRRSHTTSKEPSPEKMSLAPAPVEASGDSPSQTPVDIVNVAHDGHNDDGEDDDDPMRDTEGEPELDPLEVEDGDNLDDPSEPAKTQRIMLVIGRKRKADDEITNVSSELQSPAASPMPKSPAAAADAPSIDHTATDIATDLPTSIAADDTAAPEPAVPESSASVIVEPTSQGNDTTNDAALAAQVAAEEEKGKRAPRKRQRKRWLRRGEVDPDDLEAVAAQKARHAMIDAAIAALDEQEQLIRDGTHAQLIELWEDLEQRRETRLRWNEAKFNADMSELNLLRKGELEQIRFQFKTDCESLSTQMTFESRRNLSRLEAEKTFLDQDRVSTKRKYTNMPTLGDGRGAGGWRPAFSGLLSTGEGQTILVKVGDELRERRRIPLGIEGANDSQLKDDLVDMGLREPSVPPTPSPESSPEPEPEPVPIPVKQSPRAAPVPVPAPAPRPQPAFKEPAYSDSAYKEPSRVAASSAQALAHEYDHFGRPITGGFRAPAPRPVAVVEAPKSRDLAPPPRDEYPREPEREVPPRDYRGHPRNPYEWRPDPRDPRADPRDPRMDPRVDPRADPRADPRVDPRADPRMDPRAHSRADPRDARGDPRADLRPPVPGQAGSGAPSHPSDRSWWGMSPAHAAEVEEQRHKAAMQLLGPQRDSLPPPPREPASRRLPPPGGAERPYDYGAAREPPQQQFWGRDWRGGPEFNEWSGSSAGRPPYYTSNYAPPADRRMYPQGSSAPAAYATSRGP